MRWLCVAALSYSPSLAHAERSGEDGAICGEVADGAERAFGLPSGMLRAIGKVESGSWPWAANVDGAAETYRSRAEATEALLRVRTRKPTNIDVGCFQISMRYHPMAFASYAEALDPTANATYAARFLRDLHDRLGDWNRAAGAYHSATPVLEAAYRERVMAVWKDVSPAAPASATQSIAEISPRWRVVSIGPVVRPAVTVWTLASAQASNVDEHLPRVITPTH